ncbi:hypothetical protein I302_107419 [Kwoniella bestiolae CBS 10118]|uniref:Uncharacterized protein n=1 Tax=Kwoniella bestiolae CBS 10118 TaxID=1296100 RepID=A0A1B9FYL6_9TREE|nr:hypothetical protein I302_06840 [Kwoniella bestiolae CBS 10118]OCF23855.1 hypothetical protein I302_06840 [Kwoniella bestiolae CBS 10118]
MAASPRSRVMSTGKNGLHITDQDGYATVGPVLPPRWILFDAHNHIKVHYDIAATTLHGKGWQFIANFTDTITRLITSYVKSIIADSHSEEDADMALALRKVFPVDGVHLPKPTGPRSISNPNTFRMV